MDEQLDKPRVGEEIIREALEGMALEILGVHMRMGLRTPVSFSKGLPWEEIVTTTLTILETAQLTTKSMKTCHWSIEMSINSRMVLFTKASGKVLLGMAMEYKSGLMVLAMKESGKTTKLMAKGSSGMSMETYLMDSGKMTKPTDTEFTLM
jgi:hypothetical protein